MAQRLPPELETKLADYQRLQAQLNAIIRERTSIETEISEIDRILQVVEEQKENVDLYRIVGNVLLKVDKEKLVNELKDRREMLQFKLQKLKKQEELLRKRLEAVLEEIRKLQARLQGVKGFEAKGGAG